MAGNEKLDLEKARRVAQGVMGDVASALHIQLCYIGDRLGIFKAMMNAGPLSIDALAAASGVDRRYLREWAAAMVAAQYVDYDKSAQTYFLAPEYAAALADDQSPFFVASYFQTAQAAAAIAPRVAQAFKDGGGVDQSEYPPSLFEAFERNSGTRYRHKLVRKWLPAMPQVVQALDHGGIMADVGCGGGRAAVMIAQAFPNARAVGVDVHPESIARARELAAHRGVADRVTFEVGDAGSLPAEKFDFVSTFDVVHDAVDPAGLMRSIHNAIKRDGTYLVQEINVSDQLTENISTLGKLGYSISTLYCLATSLAHEGAGLGIGMGEAKARELAASAGFSQFRRLPIKDEVAILFEIRP